MTPRLLLSEMTREQIAAIAPESTVVLPTAAVEQHGPHLPIQVDLLACETIAQRAAALAAATIPITVAPALPYGYSAHHRPFPGVLSLRMETFLQALADLGESLALAGFRRIFFLNGHGGNEELIRLAVRKLVYEHDVLAGAASYWTIAREAWLADPLVGQCDRLPGHAGTLETSLILALRPDLVDRANQPAPPPELRPAPEPSYYAERHRWVASINGHTPVGTPTSAALGERALTIAVEQVAAALVAFHRSL